MVLQHAILVGRKETIDLTVKGNKFYLQENSDEYGGHDLISFPRLGETSKFTGCSPHIQQPAAANLYRKSYT